MFCSPPYLVGRVEMASFEIVFRKVRLCSVPSFCFKHVSLHVDARMTAWTASQKRPRS